MASPLSTRTVRGALVSVDPAQPTPRVVAFQYNPDELVREVTPRQGPSTPGGAGGVRRMWGAGSETVTLTLELDAADAAGEANPLAGIGVAARLAALRLMLSPSLARVASTAALQAAGAIEVLPAPAPMTVLSLGPRHVVPVTVDSLTITEQAFAPDLTPLRATVAVSAGVLTYSDLPATDPGYALSVVHQGLQESLALLAPAVTVGEG